MKNRCVVILLTGLFLIQCKKQMNNSPAVLRGVNFDLLLKTVDIYNNGESTTTYTYDNFKQLIEENSIREFRDGTKWKVTNSWFRSSPGRIDSMKSEYTYGTDPTGLQKLYYYYDPSGKLTYNILYRNTNNPISSIDSCVYTYSAGLVTKRLDYTSAQSTILNHTLTHEIYYQYDTSKNIAAITFVNYDFSRGAPAHKDTVILSYAYDNKKNPYQNDAFYEYFVNFAFDSYVSTNNITRILYNGASSSNYKDEFTFQYNVANKPDRVFVSSLGVRSSQATTWTTDYYYD
jgi:YD repeat-containing protein